MIARTSMCRGCNHALTWSGHFWTHNHTGARLCHAEKLRNPKLSGDRAVIREGDHLRLVHLPSD